MRSFTPPTDTRFYAGVDLHARALFLVILDCDGKVVFARNLPANPDSFLRAVAPFRDGLLVACECTAGTGSPTAAATKKSPSSSVTPGP
jgi:hypothetical protein